ncbi:hypothetical protein AJ79_08150 [Helicocarpus griseus UAMH5409]|uniref:Uncharacterized protein n=1 Tax=Helicocarpus griseus UAMH5409 TaxID=1447875 RepID=A0A2B7WMP5_9EURO|nr:hypothetical protein AJ79_08150 [Helicocarpus griseus UAMH5409]
MSNQTDTSHEFDYSLHSSPFADGMERNREPEGLQVVQPDQKEFAGDHSIVGKYNGQYNGTQPTILGMRRRVFFILFAVIIAILVGVGVGGGLGGYYAGRNNNDSQLPPSSSTGDRNAPSNNPSKTVSASDTAITTPTPTSTDAPAAYATSGISGFSENPCPSANDTEVMSGNGVAFKLRCSTDWPKGHRAANGQGKVLDLGQRQAYTLAECLNECVKYNRTFKDACKAVTYESDLTMAYRGEQGNCYLKDRAGMSLSARDSTMAAEMIDV